VIKMTEKEMNTSVFRRRLLEVLERIATALESREL